MNEQDSLRLQHVESSVEPETTYYMQHQQSLAKVLAPCRYQHGVSRNKLIDYSYGTGELIVCNRGIDEFVRWNSAIKILKVDLPDASFTAIAEEAGAESVEIRSSTRFEGTTVHAALIAAAGIAARGNERYGVGRDLHLCSTINNRALLGSPEDCGVFFSASDFAFADGATQGLWELARKAKRAIAPGQSTDGVKAVLGAVNAIVQSDLDIYSAGEQGARLFLFDLHISNLGAVPIPTSYGSLSIRRIWGPGVLVGFKGEQTLGASTVNGHLCLLHTSHNPLPRFLDQIESILVAGCDS